MRDDINLTAFFRLSVRALASAAGSMDFTSKIETPNRKSSLMMVNALKFFALQVEGNGAIIRVPKKPTISKTPP